MLGYPPEIRRVLYTTTVESLNNQLRKVTRERGHFAAQEALLRLLYLDLRNIMNKKAHRGQPTPSHSAGRRLNQFGVFFPGGPDLDWPHEYHDHATTSVPALGAVQG
jgi:putative transposase